MSETTEKQTAPEQAPAKSPGPAHPFRAVRRASVPLVGYETPDYEASMKSIEACLNGKAKNVPICSHDLVRGLVGRNEPGEDMVRDIFPNGPIDSTNTTECLAQLASKISEGAVVFMLNFHRAIQNGSEVWNPGVSTGLYLCRSAFESKGANLVLLAPALTLPPELVHDVITVSEELPDGAALEAIVDDVVATAGIPGPDEAESERCVDILRGLSAFEAKQVACLAVTKQGLDCSVLWSRKKRAIEQTPGLQVWEGNEGFADLGGLDNLKGYLTRLLTSGRTPVRGILYMDEIEKSLQGLGNPGDGTTGDQLGVILREMQDENLPGVLLVGPPGTGKSAIAKAAGRVAGAPVIAADMGAMKSKWVGESEQQIRAAMKQFRSISQGKGMVIATCNKLAVLPPELKRRFKLGTFFIDLPSTAEQDVIWPIWRKRFDIPAGDDLPACQGWTGAEISACCEVAYRINQTLAEAAEFIVPVCKSGAESIRLLREVAKGNFISASYSGMYRGEYGATTSSQAPAAGRRITTE